MGCFPDLAGALDKHLDGRLDGRLDEAFEEAFEEAFDELDALPLGAMSTNDSTS